MRIGLWAHGCILSPGCSVSTLRTRAMSRSRLGVCGVFLMKPYSKLICPATMQKSTRAVHRAGRSRRTSHRPSPSGRQTGNPSGHVCPAPAAGVRRRPNPEPGALRRAQLPPTRRAGTARGAGKVQGVRSRRRWRKAVCFSYPRVSKTRRAVAKICSSMARVRRPVEVFCWLG